MFNTESFRVASRHFNLVAFAVDVGLLLKVLRSAVTNAPDTLDVKLTQCAVALPGCDEVENKPFLCFTARVSSAGTSRCASDSKIAGRTDALAGSRAEQRCYIAALALGRWHSSSTAGADPLAGSGAPASLLVCSGSTWRS